MPKAQEENHFMHKTRTRAKAGKHAGEQATGGQAVKRPNKDKRPKLDWHAPCHQHSGNLVHQVGMSTTAGTAQNKSNIHDHKILFV